MTFRLIAAERAQHSVSRLCGVLGVSRGGFYAWSGRSPSARELRDRELLRLIEQIHRDSRGTYGVPRIHADLEDDHGIGIARKRVARLMRRLGIEGVSRRGKRPITTTPKAPAPSVDDLVRRQFRAPEPNRLWVADIPYVPTREGFLFLAAVIDAFSRRCVGWSMRADLKAELVLDALGMAITQRRPAPGLIHHSDRGSPNTRASRSARRSPTPGCCNRSVAAVTRSTTPSPSRSSPRSRQSSSLASRSPAATTHGSRYSTSSKASTTQGDATQRWRISLR
jgi:putative transposase